jgi:cytochrome c55X
MADKPLDSMTATIFGGRPGTPMPPWRTFMSEAEARWIAERLAQGLGPVLEAAR